MEVFLLAIISVKSLLEAGVHFGHRVSRWNPKMAPYIFGRRNLIHIINLKETVKGLIRSYHFLKSVTAEGQEILFVGTKRQAKNVIKQEAQRCQMHYVSERWLGGTLTNFSTIRIRLSRLEELEKMEEDGSMASLRKKMASTLRREERKIHRNLEGIRKMEKLPGALVIVDPQKEHIAVKEAVKLNIPTICLMDTDSDPDLVDIPIPGNDDAMRSIQIISNKLADAIVEGRAIWEEKQKLERKKRQELGGTRESGHFSDGRRYRQGDRDKRTDRGKKKQVRKSYKAGWKMSQRDDSQKDSGTSEKTERSTNKQYKSSDVKVKVEAQKTAEVKVEVQKAVEAKAEVKKTTEAKVTSEVTKTPEIKQQAKVEDKKTD